ncbi:hypothetical protein C0Q70_15930 [Pomacea canaliculata]|uniref:Uncharacterized protein n=1 Tax=Pomacea canaliculata TaxID=400727 RepID=A0A2T7NNC7_POMCA|nr:hypothetical protein C0Q70_15930 [Pomacea canaliculata]
MPQLPDPSVQLPPGELPHRSVSLLLHPPGVRVRLATAAAHHRCPPLRHRQLRRAVAYTNTSVHPGVDNTFRHSDLLQSGTTRPPPPHHHHDHLHTTTTTPHHHTTTRPSACGR